MARKTAFTLLLLTLTVTACQPTEESTASSQAVTSSTETDEASILAFLENYRKGIEAADVNVMRDAIASDAVGFFGAGSFSGEQEFVSGSEDWFNESGSIRLSYSDIVVHLGPSGDAAWVSYIEDGSSSEGEASWQVRATLGLEKQGADWVIVQAHWSVPFTGE